MEISRVSRRDDDAISDSILNAACGGMHGVVSIYSSRNTMRCVKSSRSTNTSKFSTMPNKRQSLKRLR